jgi:tetratricopeptide (TPR) repeat protein
MGLFSKNKAITIQDAKSNYQKGNYKKALKLAKELLKNKDKDFETLNLLGDIYYKINDKNNSLDAFRKVIAQLEADKYIDRAIAVNKKVIRNFPDQYDLYRKLSKFFEMKGLVAEQLKILYDLSNIYQTNGLEDKAIDILKEIAEVDRNNLNNYIEIIKKFDELGRKFEISKFIYPALELAYNKNNEKAIDTFVNIAIKNKIDLKKAIKYTAPFFEKNKDQISEFNRFAKDALDEEFDELLFNKLVSLNDFGNIKDIVLSIKDKYQEIIIYDYLLDQFVLSEDLPQIMDLLNEINSLPDYLFKSSYSEIIAKHLDAVVDIDALDLMVTIAGKCSDKELQILIYKKLSNIYKNNNEPDKAERITQYINELSYQDYGVSPAETPDYIDEINIEDSNAEESITDLLESTSLNTNANVDDEFELDFDSDDDGSISNEDSNISSDEFELDLDDDIESTQEETEKLDEVEIETDEIESTDDTEEFTLDLGLNDDNTDGPEMDVINVDDTVKATDEGDISSDFELELDDLSTENQQEETVDTLNFDDFTEESIFDEENEIEDTLNQELNEINILINDNKKLEAKEKLDDLLEKNPDNIKLNELSSLLDLELDTVGDNSKDVKISKTDDSDPLSDLIYSFKNVVSGIRKSINDQVSVEDYETHYDLAMAYMEMELYDEAIEELKKSATGTKKYESLFLMAECYKRMKQYEESIGIHKLIVIDFKDQEKLKNSLYEIAIISELQGDNSSSMNFLQKISKLDPDFRDVRSRLSGESQDNTFFNENDNINILESSNDDESSVVKKTKKISFL